MSSINILFEVSPILPNGNLTTLRMSADKSSSAGVYLNGHEWIPIITERPTFDIKLTSNGLLDEIQISYGSISFNMSDVFGNEVWSTYDWTGALGRIWVGEEGSEFTDYDQIFEGSVSALSREDFTASCALLGTEADLNVNLLYDSYEGTGGEEGPTSLKGTLKPWASGICLNVDPLLVDSAYWVYQVHGYGPIQEIPAVYEFGQKLADPVASVSTYAELVALTLVPGQWAKCLPLGMFRLGGQPSQKLTADIHGAKSGSTFPSTISNIIRHLVLTAALTATFGDLSIFDAVSWCYYTKQQATVGDIARKAALDAGGYLFPDGEGRWQIGDFFAPKTARILSTERDAEPLVVSITEATTGGPISKVRIGHDRCWSVHSDAEVSPAILDLSQNADVIAQAAADALEAAQQAQADLDIASIRLDAMAADGVLDRAEKKYWVQEYAKLATERSNLIGEAEQYDVAGELDALNAAHSNLTSYLTALVPAWNDGSQDTEIDRTAFKAAWSNYYSARQTLRTAITEQTAKLANWTFVDGAPADLSALDPISGAKLDGVEEGADVTRNVLENARFDLAGKADRIATEVRGRFDPIFWTCNFPSTMMASVRVMAAGTIQLDAVFHERGHLAGLIWESEDSLDHATTAYDTNRDYRGCTLSFDYELLGDVRAVDEIGGVTLTIEGRNSSGLPMTTYVLLYHCRTSGDGVSGHCVLDFDDLPGGYDGGDHVYAGDIDRMFLSFVPGNFEEGSTERLGAPIEGSLTLSNMVVSGSNSTLTCGLGPGGVHRLRMANGYDDTYNVAPARIVRNCGLLGYKGEFNHYVGMSHYFDWAWSSGESRYVAQDISSPLNTPCRLWHENLAQQLRAADMTLILSLSYEMLNSFVPADWRQKDSDGQPALTGWEPPSSLISPCHSDAMSYLQRVAKQFASIAADADLAVHFQVGEPWYWVDFRTYRPYFYDAATTARYAAHTGLTAPIIESMTGAMDAAQLAYLDWLGEQLAGSILDLLTAVRAEHPAMRSYALLYLPQLLNEQTPETHRVNMPPALAYPALDVLQVEDYDFVIENRTDLSATGRARIEETLGYPRSAQHYFAGFALYRDTGTIWRYSTNAAAAAYEWGVDPVFIWAYTQVMRDGYVPKIRSAPAPLMHDLKDVALAMPAAANDVLTFEPSKRIWKPGKPWLSDLPDPADNTLLNLQDVPDSYMGSGLNYLRVKIDGSGIEFAAVRELPNGGVSGQILQKFNGADGASTWSDLTAGIVGCAPVGSITATDVQLAISQLDAQKQSSLIPPAIQIPTLNSPWINYGSGYLGARYYKTAEGIVFLEGLIQAPSGSGTSGITLFTLLDGFRPTGTLMFGVWSGGGACRIDINEAGEVMMQSGNTAFTSLSGISFVAA